VSDVRNLGRGKIDHDWNRQRVVSSAANATTNRPSLETLPTNQPGAVKPGHKIGGAAGRVSRVEVRVVHALRTML
jgi:hypothetical protein